MPPTAQLALRPLHQSRLLLQTGPPVVVVVVVTAAAQERRPTRQQLSQMQAQATGMQRSRQQHPSTSTGVARILKR
jgi:hypothetical protein